MHEYINIRKDKESDPMDDEATIIRILQGIFNFLKK